MSQKFQDFKLAHMLNERMNSLGVTENAVIGGRVDYKPRTLVDQTLELIDPTPNIYTLFVQFNQRFFWNILLPVEVKWSNRMTSCAGICSYHPRNKQCVITLSAPLLKLRPRKDLVETLLHEMIHGYLFLTNNNRDRDGHGPEFCKHMRRINTEAGTNITIYHDFHDEVRLYKQHWWRCDGPCQKQAPYFGTVRRAMNRAPGPSDFWWKDHQRTCGGKFVKIKEPEKVTTKNAKSNSKVTFVAKNITNNENILGWLTQTKGDTDNTLTKGVRKVFMPLDTCGKSCSNAAINKGDKTGNDHAFGITRPVQKGAKSDIHSNTESTGIRKLGSSANNVHGWSVAGPNSSGSCKNSSNKTTNTPKFSCSGQLGGAKSGKTNLLDKFCHSNKKHNKLVKIDTRPEKTINFENTLRALTNDNEKSLYLSDNHNFDLISCPVCNIFTHRENINKHLDACLGDSCNINSKCMDDDKSTVERLAVTMEQPSTVAKRKIPSVLSPAKRVKTDDLKQSNCAKCPICYEQIELMKINDHLDNCLLHNESKDREDEEDKCSPHHCLVCNSIISPEVSLNDHLEDCVGSIFHDDSDDMIDVTEEKSVNETRFPCPSCMELHSNVSMNEHLDKCLTVP